METEHEILGKHEMTETPLLEMAEMVSVKSRQATSANSNPQVQLTSVITAVTAGATSPRPHSEMTVTPTTTMAVVPCVQWSQAGNVQEAPPQQLILVEIYEVMVRSKALIPQLIVTMAIIATMMGAILLAQLRLSGSDQEVELILQVLVQTSEVTVSK